MNTDQFLSFARWLLNAVSGGIIAYTAAKSPAAQSLGAFLSGLLTGPDAVAGVVLALSWLWGHLTHSTPPPSGGTSKAGGTLPLLVAISVISASVLSGCQSTPQKVAYESVGASAIAVQAALAAYDTLAAQGKTTPAENAQVKDMYLKYQTAFAAVCDAGAIYSATAGTTNVTGAAFNVYQVAQTNATEMAGDFVAFIKSFGIKF